ncbi:MAG: PQQ-binding-like beta-propeller repeat protein [Gemmataceae bacterium]
MLRTCLVVSVALLASAAHADDWPQWLGIHRDGVSKETGLIKTWPKDGPPRLWSKKVGEGYSGPVVAGERLVVFHRVGDEEVVACWKAESGEEVWKFAYPTSYQDALGKGDGPRSTPCIAGKRVVTLGAEGKLHCVDLEKGTKVWGVDLQKVYRIPPIYFGVGTSPLVVGDRVLINVGGKDAGIVAFSMESGKELWKATNDPASYSSPAVWQDGDKKRAVFLTREGVVILDLATGSVLYQQRWRARIAASVNAATPLILGNEAFFSASYDTGALLLRLGKKITEEWNSDELMSNHYNTCVFKDGHLYGFHGREESKPAFRCVELKTKKVCWEKDRYGCGAMVLAGDRLTVLLESGEMALVVPRPERYEEIGRFTAFRAPPCRAQIALSGGRLYGRDQSELSCWDLRAKK